MRQRAMVALSLSCRPKLLIADEPTTAVDVTIQAQMLELLRDIQADLGMAIIMITHDLGVIAELTDRVMIMYLGQRGGARNGGGCLSAGPQHPYTRGLLASIPKMEPGRVEIEPIEGNGAESLRNALGLQVSYPVPRVYFRRVRNARPSAH